jgi:hypothetical protein
VELGQVRWHLDLGLRPPNEPDKLALAREYSDSRAKRSLLSACNS